MQSANQPPREPFPAAQAVAKTFVLEYWEKRLVDVWLADHLPLLAALDGYKDDPEEVVSFARWREKVRSGAFVGNPPKRPGYSGLWTIRGG